MWIQQALAHAEDQATSTASACPMCEWMMGGGSGSVWGWMMMGGMMLFGLLVIVALVLLIVWLIKQVRK